MEQDQYVGWDVHQASTSCAVLDSSGRLVEEGVPATSLPVRPVRPNGGCLHLYGVSLAPKCRLKPSSNPGLARVQFFSLGGHGLRLFLEFLCYAAAQARSNALSIISLFR